MPKIKLSYVFLVLAIALQCVSTTYLFMNIQDNKDVVESYQLASDSLRKMSGTLHKKEVSTSSNAEMLDMISEGVDIRADAYASQQRFLTDLWLSMVLSIVLLIIGFVYDLFYQSRLSANEK